MTPLAGLSARAGALLRQHFAVLCRWRCESALPSRSCATAARRLQSGSEPFVDGASRAILG